VPELTLEYILSKLTGLSGGQVKASNRWLSRHRVPMFFNDPIVLLFGGLNMFTKQKMTRRGLVLALCLGLLVATGGVSVFAESYPASPYYYFNGFENPEDVTSVCCVGDSTMFGVTRESTGTNGIPAAAGSYYATVPLITSWSPYAYTRYGGFSSVFPQGGYTTSIDIYLDIDMSPVGQDLRFDWTSAISHPSGAHRRDFIFSIGTNGTGGYVMSVSNNAPGWPADPGRSPYTITTTGWYTFEHHFKDNGSGVLAVDMSVLNSNGTVLKTWTLSDPTDVIGTTVGGNRYGGAVNNQIPSLPIDNIIRSSIPAEVSLVANSDEVCGAATVDINFDKVENLYGYEFKVNYNPARVTAEGAFDNSWFDTALGGSFGDAWKASCTAGTCRFASTFLHPAAPVSGGGTVGTIDLSALTPGLFDMSVYDVILSDIDGFIIPAEVTTLPLSFTACGVATISGKVSLQGRLTPIDAGTVKLIGSAGFGPYEVNFSAADGSYTIPNVLYQLGGTTYDFQAAHGLYLGNEKTQAVNGNLTGQNTRLLGGDANNSGIVELLDLSCIGGDFGGPPSDCMGAGSSDINADTKVNIQDLAIAGGNFYKETYQPW
jgi:hypothetical protein